MTLFPRLALLATALVLAFPAGASAGTLDKPIDPQQQSALAWGQRSHWLQPWRAYLETVPASKLRDGAGIVWNYVNVEEAESTARLLARSGFKRVRVEIPWASLSYDDPSRFKDDWTRRTLTALKRNGLRPLILLNAYHGSPTPMRSFEVKVTAPAGQGARRLQLDPASAAAVVPHHTGLNALDGRNKAADVMFTSVAPDGSVELSKPLPRALGPGTYKASTLRWMPFGPPMLEDGSPNPAFQETLQGWLSYVAAVTREAKSVIGSDAFDVEVWNELTFGSDFLYQDRYYSPSRERGKGDIRHPILDPTVRWLRDPRNGVPHVGITNGFASQTPFDSGANSPAGLTALSKHPYKTFTRFPSDAEFNDNTPVDARGAASFFLGRTAAGQPARRDRFVPTYDAFFPEYFLSGIQVETLVRSVSPTTTVAAGNRHGRNVLTPDGRHLGVWLTEQSLVPGSADPANPANAGGAPLPKLGPGDIEHLQTKSALRSFSSYINKGVGAVYLFSAKMELFSLIQSSFFAQARNGYPGDDAGGEATTSMRRFMAAFRGPARIGRTRQLRLLSISDKHNRRQFDGDGTPAHPPLYDREVLGFFPFQVTKRRFVVPIYVMTRNMAKLQQPGLPQGDRRRFDLKPESFRIQIGGLPGRRVRASATDPITGRPVRAKVVSRRADWLTVSFPATDYPRLLTLELR